MGAGGLFPELAIPLRPANVPFAVFVPNPYAASNPSLEALPASEFLPVKEEPDGLSAPTPAVCDPEDSNALTLRVLNDRTESLESDIGY